MNRFVNILMGKWKRKSESFKAEEEMVVMQHIYLGEV